MSAKRPQDWSAEEKLQVVLESSSISSEELGAFLRSKGLHESHLDQWRSQMLNGLYGKLSPKKTKKNGQTKEVKELKRELARKEKALAEAAALLVLKKKPNRSGGTRTKTLQGRTGSSAGAR